MNNNDAINYEIARIKGWKWYKYKSEHCPYCHLVLYEDKDPILHLDTPEDNWSNDNMMESVDDFDPFTESHDLSHYERRGMVPDWSRSYQFCMELFEEMASVGVVRLSNGDGDSCDLDFILYWNGRGSKSFHISEASNFKIAVCRAWIAWKRG